MLDLLDLWSLLNAKYDDLCGERFGRLTAIRPVRCLPGVGVVWQCVCDCGTVTDPVRAGNLKSCNTQSCGCLRRERVIAASTTHGMSKSPEYVVWQGMLQRCNNPNNDSYPHYGGLGVCVCPRWEFSFKDFYDDMGARPSDKHQIDRIDAHGDYEPDNCQWELPGKGAKRDQ